MNLIIDCDPAGLIGSGLDADDDLALMAALRLMHSNHDSLEKLKVLGITTTSGNAPLRFTTANARAIVESFALSSSKDETIQVFPGLPTRFSHPPPKKSKNATDHYKSEATQFLLDILQREPAGTITLLCLGPLTNLAAAMALDNNMNRENDGDAFKVLRRLKQVVIMGGTISPDLPMDLNMRSDPHAAAFVMNQFPNNYVDTVVIPVETCTQAVFQSQHLAQVQAHCRQQQYSQSSVMICRYQTRLWAQINLMPWLVNWRFMTSEQQQRQRRQDGSTKGFILWDIVALWAALYPDQSFTDWASYRLQVDVQPRIRTKFTLVADDTRRNGNGTTPGVVRVPRRVSNGDDGGGGIAQELLDHLLAALPPPPAEASNAVLDWRTSLGQLPEFAVSLLLVFMGSLFFLRQRRRE